MDFLMRSRMVVIQASSVDTASYSLTIYKRQRERV